MRVCQIRREIRKFEDYYGIHRWASLIQKVVPLIVGPLLYGLVSLTAGPLTLNRLGAYLAPLGFSGITPETLVNIDMKLGMTLRTSILHRLVKEKSDSGKHWCKRSTKIIVLMRCNLKCVFYIEKLKNRAVFGISHWENKWLLMVATSLDSEYSQYANTLYNRGIIASSKLIFYWWIGNCPK